MTSIVPASGFSGLVVPTEVSVPATVDDVVERLDGVVGILNAAEWGVAAIVWAHTYDTGGGRPAKVDSSGDFLNVTEFADLGIRALSSPTTVRKYRRAWQHAIDEGWATPVDPGEVAKLPDREFEAPPTKRADPLIVAPPDGRFSCLVIDPPWPMDKIERDVRPNQGPVLDYPTLTLDEIANEDIVPVRTSAADDCHLYLWVTHRFMPDGLNLMAEWGFNYQCVMTWRKNVGITPYSWMYDTEHVLFGRRGNLPLSKLGLRLSFDAPATGHSIKPDAFYDRVREASPGPRLDMFPGVEHDGFDPWGLEASHRA